MTPFVGEIKMVGFNFPPRGYAQCNGQLLPISQNVALFSILGTTYGGNGTSTFALPDLRNAGPIGGGFGGGPGLTPRELGEKSGTPTVTLNQVTLPTHTHIVETVNTTGNSNSPSGTTFAIPHSGRAQDRTYGAVAPQAAMATGIVSAVGGGQPHNNLPPYLGVFYIIALQGVFPSRN